MQNQVDNNNKNTQKSEGITRIVPIILAAAAAFLAICFIFGGTGAFGHGITSVFRGLFAGGAYIIPLLLLFHAAFFKEDHAKGNIVSRAVFSLIALLIASSIDYTVYYFGKDAMFDPSMFYANQTAGGFIGGIFAFCITKIIGSVGLIILDITVLAVYAIVFFGKKDSTTRRGVLGFLEMFTALLAVIEGKIKKSAEDRREAKAEEKRQETERHHAEFLNDQFFDEGGNMDELEIRKLGIHKTRDPKNAEKNPSLQNKVFNKSAVSKEELTRERAEKDKAATKRPGFNFDIDNGAKSTAKGTSDGAVFFGATHEKFGGNRPAYDTRENASEVFTKDFDPFDFATGEKLIAKQSTRTTSVKKHAQVIDDSTSLFNVTEESIAAMHRRDADLRRRQEFEAKKAKIFGRPAPAPITAEPVPATTETKSESVSAAFSEQTASPKVPEKTPVSPNIHIPGFSTSTSSSQSATINEPTSILKPAAAVETITTEATFGTPPEITEMEFVQSNEEVVFDDSNDEEIRKIAESAAWGRPAQVEEELPEETPADIPAMPYGNPEEKDFDTVAEEIAELVRMNNPAYARSANKSIFTTTVYEHGAEPKDADTVEEESASAEKTEPEKAHSELSESIPLIIEDVTYDITDKEEKEAATFQPYTPPVVNDPAPEEPAPTLVTERELITPAPAVTPTIDDSLFETAEKEAPTVPVTEDSDATVFNFDEAEEDNISLAESAEYAEEAPEDISPIPPEEQNPDVIKQRAMFPFLDEEEKKSEPEENSYIAETEKKEEILPFEDEDTDISTEDEPPFDVAPPKKEIAKPETAVAIVEEKPKKKDYSDFVLPPIELLHAAGDERTSDDVAAEIQDNADKLIDTLASFGVTASIKGVDRGPRITRYEVVPARGTKVSSIMNLDNDIALNLAADGIRMEAPIPGKTAVGVEIPNKKASLVRLRELIETDDYRELKSKTTVCMGKDVAGQPIFADVAKMPHALVAGATGMGKSVWINSLMLSILYKARPDEVKFIMIDPKQVEFTMYNGIPHLLVPVVTDVKQAAGTLMWAVEEMERRYGVLQELCVRNIDAYNDKIAATPSLGEPMSRIVIVIDEFAELIMQAKNPVESLIIRIAQKARAAGIHLIIGTQKPVKEVITGLIKSNIPSKFSCKVASNRDSILIFDAAGAEKLLDKGDMLVSFANSIKPLRVQSAFVADDEVETVMEYLKSFSDGTNYDESVMEEIKRAADKCSKKGGSDRDDDDDDEGSDGEGYLNDKQFLSAVEIAVNTGKISTSLIQRKLSIGYGKAAKFIDIMEDIGVVGESNGSKPREVLITANEWYEKLARTSYD